MLVDETVLAARARETAASIERRVTYMRDESRRAVERFLWADDGPISGPPPDETSGESAAGPPSGPQTVRERLRWPDLARFAPHWASLVPAEPGLRAALASELGRRYRPAASNLSPCLAALGPLDETERRSLETVLLKAAEGTNGGPEVVESDPDAHAAMLEGLNRELEWVFVQKGDAVCRQGDPSDSVYIVVSGRLRVTVNLPSGGELPVGEIGRGETVGEMGLLVGEPRSAHVYAIRDTELVRLSKAGFERVVEQHPRLLMGVTRLLVNRLSRSIHGTRAVNAVATIAIVPASPELPVEPFARSLAAALEAFGPTYYLNRARLEERLGQEVTAELERPADLERVVAWLNDLEVRYRFVVLEAEPHVSAWTRRAIRQADRVLIVAEAQGPAVIGDIEVELLQHASDRLNARQDLVILHRGRSQSATNTAALLGPRTVTAHFHVVQDYPPDLLALARRLVGRAVGLVLGSGGARGFAHLGVVRAMREAGIPFDLVGGTSAGALVGAQVAAGWDDATMLEANRDLARRAHQLFDYTVPLVSFMAAGRFYRLLTQMFGDIQIEDLWTQYFCASSNLSRAQLMIHERGLLRQAVRASCSLPGVMPPVPYQGDLLADGVLLESLPVDTMSRLCDGGPVIAVDVSSDVDLAQDYDFGPSLSGFHLLRNWLRPFRRRSMRVPNIMTVMARAAELSSVRTRLSQSRKVSLYLTPPVTEYGLFDVKAMDTIIERGYRTASEQLERWWPSVAP